LVKVANIPSSVEINLRKKGNSVFLYLINFTSEMKRPIERIIPVDDIKIDILLPEKVRNVKALLFGGNLNFTQKENVTSFILSRIEDYEILKIDLS
jgi:hypothetical protein